MSAPAIELLAAFAIAHESARRSQEEAYAARAVNAVVLALSPEQRAVLSSALEEAAAQDGD